MTNILPVLTLRGDRSHNKLSVHDEGDGNAGALIGIDLDQEGMIVSGSVRMNIDQMITVRDQLDRILQRELAHRATHRSQQLGWIAPLVSEDPAVARWRAQED